MGKLVLGIIAIGLLQVAFFVYLPTDPSAPVDGGIAKSSPVKPPVQSRVDRIPDAIAPPSLPPAEVDSPRTDAESVATADRSSRITRSRPNAEHGDRVVWEDSRVPSASYASLSRSDTVPKRTSPAIPSGYTMVLVDHLPGAASPNKTPGRANNKTTTASTNTTQTIASVRTDDAPRVRKRPFLVRAMPALVKKPWNWIKSVASKMD